MIQNPTSKYHDAEEMLLDRQVCFGLYAASHVMTKAYRVHLKPYGITYPQLLVLMALWERDCQTVTALGEILLLDSGTLSPLLKRLDAAGLVRKIRQKADERQVEISLTEQGRSLRTDAQEVRRKVHGGIGLTEAEATDLRFKLDLVISRAQGHMADVPALAAE